MTRSSGSDTLSWCRTTTMIPCFFLLCGSSHGLHLRQSKITVLDDTRNHHHPLIGSTTTDGRCTTQRNSSSSSSRRDVFRDVFGVSLAGVAAVSRPQTARAGSALENHPSGEAVSPSLSRPFVYSDSWTGTRLSIRTLDEATASGAYATEVVFAPNGNDGDADSTSVEYRWEMGRWPDPALRIAARPVDPALWRESEGEQKLRLAAKILRDTARNEGAVGLAAQQCGVDARMVYLSSSPPPTPAAYYSRGANAAAAATDRVLINPRIVARSPESSMRVWTEECLVLPPTFRATVLRDDWIDVEYDCEYQYEYHNKSRGSASVAPRLVVSSKPAADDASLRTRFFGEHSRCLQHELDHDRGILITDHVGLDELESDTMRRIETEGHDRRQAVAYSRSVF